MDAVIHLLRVFFFAFMALAFIRAEAQTPVPVYVDPQADTFADWQWQCTYHIEYVYIDDFPNAWRPYWYHGFARYRGDWWNGYVPHRYWQPYFYASCYWVQAGIYDLALIQVANSESNCTYTITIRMSDGTDRSVIRTGNGSSIDYWVLQGYRSGPTVLSASAVKQCPDCSGPIVDLNQCPNRVSNGIPPSANGCTAVPDNPSLLPPEPLPAALLTQLAPLVDTPIPSGPSFRPACDYHDNCFTTCNPNGTRNVSQGKAFCDNNFGIYLRGICEHPTVTSNPIMYAQCDFFRNTYISVVSSVSPQYFYIPAQKHVCKCCP